MCIVLDYAFIFCSALIDHLRPGTSPNWRELHAKNAYVDVIYFSNQFPECLLYLKVQTSKNSTFCLFSVENCRTAILLAKEHLNIPRVISPEDFASEALDELSAMTYLSYFVRSESPGYYDTLNWVCKQLRTTQITNLTVRKSVFSRKYRALSVTRKIALKSNATLTPTWSLLFQIFFLCRPTGMTDTTCALLCHQWEGWSRTGQISTEKIKWRIYRWVCILLEV